ncbi:cold shock domain-containing protein [Sesbania bispinosa]|nr:cold shock domain-containing protein [Sesbania bispinosa]
MAKNQKMQRGKISPIRQSEAGGNQVEDERGKNYLQSTMNSKKKMREVESVALGLAEGESS